MNEPTPQALAAVEALDAAHLKALTAGEPFPTDEERALIIDRAAGLPTMRANNIALAEAVENCLGSRAGYFQQLQDALRNYHETNERFG